MKEYLKMADYIIGDVSMSMNHNGDVAVYYDYANPDMVVRKTMDAMEHAINSHDELVTMNRELLSALEACKFDSLNMSIDDLCAIRSVMAKAKGESQ